MPYTYLVLGAGRQGTAAAYDLACWGDGERVILADVSLENAQNAVQRTNQLLKRPVAEAIQVDVTDLAAVANALRGMDGVLSAVPYYYNLPITRIAIEAGVHYTDLGGHTGIVLQQHALNAAASSAGVSVIPDCGQVPGLGTSLMVHAISLLDQTNDVFMWDGGNAQSPRPPFNYMMTFNIAGLTNEYAEPAIFLRHGKVTEVEPMTELETIDFDQPPPGRPPIGRMEAFVTGGGTSSMPYRYEGRLRTLQNLTLRWPGHFAQLRAFYDLGLWSLEPIQVPGPDGPVTVVPRDVFHALYAPKVSFPQDRDFVIVRVKAVGMKDGRPAQALVTLYDYYDEVTGFTAMERATGWDAAIILEMAVRGETPHGAGGVEDFVPPAPFMAELRKRGFYITETIEELNQ